MYYYNYYHYYHIYFFYTYCNITGCHQPHALRFWWHPHLWFNIISLSILIVKCDEMKPNKLNLNLNGTNTVPSKYYLKKIATQHSIWFYIHESISSRRQFLKKLNMSLLTLDKWILLFNVKWATTSFTQYWTFKTSGSLGSKLKRPKIVNLEWWWLLLNKVFYSKLNIASIFWLFSCTWISSKSYYFSASSFSNYFNKLIHV